MLKWMGTISSEATSILGSTGHVSTALDLAATVSVKVARGAAALHAIPGRSETQHAVGVASLSAGRCGWNAFQNEAWQ